jgi:hypothetical protein
VSELLTASVIQIINLREKSLSIDIFSLLWATGLSNRIEIESYFVIESKVFAHIKSNRMQIESNEILDFRYDSIRFDLGRKVNKKNPELW